MKHYIIKFFTLEEIYNNYLINKQEYKLFFYLNNLNSYETTP